MALIDLKALSMGHARALLGLENDAERVRLGELVAERAYSVRVELQQKSSGAGKLIVEFADPKSRDAMVEAIKKAVE